MNKISDFIERSFVPKVSKITNMRYLQALRNGFLSIIPLTIIGSLFMLITDFPIPGYANMMSSIFGSEWTNYISPTYRATFNMMGVLFAGTMSFKLAESYKMDKLTSLILGIVSYIIVVPKTLTLPSGKIVTDVLSFNWLGTQGIITAFIMSIVSVEITRFCIQKNLTIKMPDSVPEMVSKAFSALIPGFLIALASLLINGLGMFLSDSFPQLIYQLIQSPLQGIIGSPFAIILVAGLNGLLWWFGVHPTSINSMLYPILYANADKNQTLANLGKLTIHSGKFGTVQMLDQFATIGGAGCTLGLAISMLIVARSSRMKAMSKIASLPALFNINEPLIFGLPVLFNPTLFIPLILAPIVSVLTALVSMSLGFMPMFTNVQAPWATPFIFSGFITNGWQGAVTQIVAVVICVLIYYPFVRALDDQYVHDEEVEKAAKGEK